MASAGTEHIVATVAEAEAADEQPLLVLEPVARFLDERGIGSGPITARRIGEGGGSNFSYLLERDGARLVLRRPPRPPLPPSAHDMVREARLQLALAPHGIRLPKIRAVCEDESVLGVPFYVMDFIDGTRRPGHAAGGPRERGGPAPPRARPRRRARRDPRCRHDAEGLAAFVRPGSYLERQVRRFSQLWEINRTRPLPVVEQVAERLAEEMPEPLPSTVVHGDYRLGNAIVDGDDPSRIVAVLDWEMGAIGDPRADVGYLLATYSEAGAASPLGTSPVTAAPGFPTRAELVERYEERSGRRVEALGWFQALALWKAAVFCEAIYGRYLRGELTEDDARAARFEEGVPALAEGAMESLGADRVSMRTTTATVAVIALNQGVCRRESASRSCSRRPRGHGRGGRQDEAVPRRDRLAERAPAGRDRDREGHDVLRRLQSDRSRRPRRPPYRGRRPARPRGERAASRWGSSTTTACCSSPGAATGRAFVYDAKSGSLWPTSCSRPLLRRSSTTSS